MDSTSTIRSDAVTNPTTSHKNTASAGNATRGATQADGSAEQMLSLLYGPIVDSLANVEKRLHSELQSPYESLVPLLRHGTQLGGKRLRPAMLLLAAEAVGGVREDHIVLGTVIEMVHTATLIHDDVLDEADTRRHVPTINSRWDNHTSILLGDFLFAQSFRLAATLESTEACRWIGEAARKVCEGELRQVLDRDQTDLDQDTYIDMLRGKTAELCRVACQLGAKYAGGDCATTAAMAEFGNSIGIAFQIADDYLDLWGDDNTVGKTLGTDILQGKMTLPVIRLLETTSEADREIVLGILKGPVEKRLSEIRPWLEQSDAREYTAAVAKRYMQTALESLSVLQPSSSKDCLTAIANFAIQRSF